MNRTTFTYAFRILGPLDGPRKRVDADAAHAAYRRCDDRAQVDKEAYLSHFQFDETFRDYLASTGSTRGFQGPTWAEEVVLDIDKEGNLPGALDDAKKLVDALMTKYGVPASGIISHFSGNKGFHIALPSRLWLANGGPLFHRVAGAFAAIVAADAGVTIDMSVYDRVRALRAPNSRHPKTGLHKRHLPADGFESLTTDEILALAQQPAPFEAINCNGMPIVDRLVMAWHVATATVAEQESAAAERRRDVADGRVKPTLNRLTLDIIRGEEVAVGDRHRLIYSAARDLAEQGAPRLLIDALLREPALDTGLPPREVDRQLDCGFHDAQSAMTKASSSMDNAPTPEGRTEQKESVR